MLSPGNLSLVMIILGPIVCRKYSSWQLQRSNSNARIDSMKGFTLFSIPKQLWLPSNILLSASFIALLYLHLSQLFDPVRLLARSDIFLVTGVNVTSSMAILRSKIAGMTFKELGWRSDWGEEGLETLLRRLSSFEGRKLHLMIGTNALLSCNYCSNANDYLIFSFSDLVLQYAADLILFGLLSLRFDSLEVIDEIVFSLVELTSGQDFRSRIHRSQDMQSSMRPDGYCYRLPLVYIIGIFALAQASVYLGLQEVSFGTGRWDHWYANYQLAYHSILLAMTLWTFLCQRIAKLPAMIEIANLIKQSRYYSDLTLTNVQAMHLTSQVLWMDPALREETIKWHEARGDVTDKTLSDAAIDDMITRASKLGVDTARLRKETRRIAEELWINAESSAEVWEQALDRPGGSISEPPTPSTASMT